MKIAIGADHAGLGFASMARAVAEALQMETLEFVPLGGARVDYPDNAKRVAEAVTQGAADLGVLVCGTGIGMSIAANKIHGVRAALCSEAYQAQMAREHNNANIVCLGERVIGPGVAEAVIRTFLTTAFAGGRHEQRVAKIAALEQP